MRADVLLLPAVVGGRFCCPSGVFTVLEVSLPEIS
jgi:hypothetical protein